MKKTSTLKVPAGKWYVEMDGHALATVDGPVVASFSLRAVPVEFQAMPELENGPGAR